MFCLIDQLYVHSMGILASKPIMDDTEKNVRAEIDEQISKYKIYMISKKTCPFCRTAKVSLIKY